MKPNTLAIAIGQYLEHKATCWTPRTLEHRAVDIRRMIKHYWEPNGMMAQPPSVAMKTSHIMAMLKIRLTPGVTRNTMLRFWVTFLSFAGWMRDVGVIDDMEHLLIKQIKPKRIFKNELRYPERRKPITEEEYKRMLDASSVTQRHWNLAIRIAWETGLRISDIAHLKMCNVDLDQCFIKVVPRKTAARKPEVREIPISRELAARIIKDNREYGGEYVCAKINRLYVKGQDHIWLSFNFIRQKSKLPKEKAFHCLRHSFITRCMKMGLRPETIQLFTGQDLSMIYHYSHPDLEYKRKVLGLQPISPITEKAEQ